MEQICPQCNKINLAQAIFCYNCGIKLPGSEYSSNTPQINGKKSGQSFKDNFRSNMELAIGRDPDCDIVLQDESVSARHAKIFIRNNNVIIEDTGSMNGVFVNGKRISTGTVLFQNDNVSLGYASLNLNHPLLISLFSKPGIQNVSGYKASGGLNNFRFNKNFTGKILFAILIAMLFLPWLKVNLNENISTFLTNDSKMTFTGLQFAFNVNPYSSEKINYNDLPYHAHTLFLALFIILLAGFAMSFINLRISKQFNVVNILSIIIFAMSCLNLYLHRYQDKSFYDSTTLQAAVYVFMFFCFISIFEGLLEYLIRRVFNKNS